MHVVVALAATSVRRHAPAQVEYVGSCYTASCTARHTGSLGQSGCCSAALLPSARLGQARTKNCLETRSNHHHVCMPPSAFLGPARTLLQSGSHNRPWSHEQTSSKSSISISFQTASYTAKAQKILVPMSNPSGHPLSPQHKLAHGHGLASLHTLLTEPTAEALPLAGQIYKSTPVSLFGLQSPGACGQSST